MGTGKKYLKPMPGIEPLSLPPHHTVRRTVKIGRTVQVSNSRTVRSELGTIRTEVCLSLRLCVCAYSSVFLESAVEMERSHSLARWKKFARIAASDKREHNDGRGRTWTWTWCAGSSCVACNNKQKSALQMAIPGVPAMPPRLVCLPAEGREEEEALLSCNRVYDLTTPHISASPRPGPSLSLLNLNPSTDHKNILRSHLLEWSGVTW